MDWQSLIVAVAILAAGVYLTLNYVRKRRSKGPCCSCPAMRGLESKNEAGSSGRLNGRGR